MKAIEKNESLSRQVFEQLKEQIIIGEWKPGEKIPSENKLCEILNVSRVTIREAIQTLVALGLLEKKRGEGTFVKKFSGETYVNSLLPAFVTLDRSNASFVHEYRKIIEVGTMEFVVERATEEDIEELKDILEKMRDYKDDLEQFALEDLNFHLALSQIAKNPIIIKANFIMKDYLKEAMIEVIKAMGPEQYALYYHKKIIETIEKRDKEKAKKLMKKHLEKNVDFFN